MDSTQLEQTEVPKNPILREFEPPKNARIPIIQLNAPEGPKVSYAVVQEVEKAALVTLNVLGVDISKYQKDLHLQDLVDLQAKNEQGLHTFPRKPEAEQDILVVVISTAPLFDTKGRETIALETQDGKVFLNLRKIEEAFSSGAEKITEAQHAGIVAVEEVIHFVQHHLWNRPFSSTEDFQPIEKAREHDEDPVEKEANRWKRKVFDVLYPELDLRIRGLDY